MKYFILIEFLIEWLGHRKATFLYVDLVFSSTSELYALGRTHLIPARPRAGKELYRSLVLNG